MIRMSFSRCRGWLFIAFISGAGSAADPEECDSPPQCFVEDGQEFCLPSVIGACCVGAGSTSLARYLNEHPSLDFGVKKEHAFFRFRKYHNRDTRRWSRALKRAMGDSASHGAGGQVPFLFGEEDWGFASVDFVTTSAVALRQMHSLPPQEYNTSDAELRAHRNWDGGLHGLQLVQFDPNNRWEDYARQFPSPASHRPIRFDFDPTYFGSMTSLASGGAIRRYLSDRVKLLFIFRDPVDQVHPLRRP